MVKRIIAFLQESYSDMIHNLTLLSYRNRDVNIDYLIRRKRFVELKTIFYENLIINVQNCKELHFKKEPFIKK